MAVGTDFSVTKKATKPIVNPAAPVDKPSVVSPEDVQGIDQAVAANAQPEASIEAPSVLTANPGTLTTPPFPLNHARILWNNLLSNGSVSASIGSTPADVLNPNTWQGWTFNPVSEGANITITVPQGISIDTIAIGAHNLSDVCDTVRIETSTTDIGAFTLLENRSISDNTPIMWYTESPFSIRRVRITSVNATGVCRIGYISAGESLQMQRPFFNGHTPINDSDVTEYYHNRTESGEIIGQMIRRQGYKTNAEWKNLDDTWYRTYFAPFKQAAKLTPFFFAWNLLEYPGDIGFCRVAKDISAPMQNGFGVKRSLSMELLGAG